MAQSSCKCDAKSKSHPSMKLAPVRVFSCKHPPKTWRPYKARPNTKIVTLQNREEMTEMSAPGFNNTQLKQTYGNTLVMKSHWEQSGKEMKYITCVTLRLCLEKYVTVFAETKVFLGNIKNLFICSRMFFCVCQCVLNRSVKPFEPAVSTVYGWFDTPFNFLQSLEQCCPWPYTKGLIKVLRSTQ